MDDVVGKNGLMRKLSKDVIFRIHIKNVTMAKFAHEYFVDFKGRASNVYKYTFWDTRKGVSFCVPKSQTTIL